MFIRDTKNIQNYRLSHPETNYLSYELARKYVPGYENDVVDTFHTIPSHGKNFVLFPMCKDAQSNNNEPGVPFFATKISEYLESPQVDKNSTLLIPLFLCRGYFRAPVNTPLKRKHAVLMEIDLKTGRLQIHDSQSSIRWAFYPDDHFYELTSLAAIKHNPDEDYHAYNIQDDDYSCGYYTHAYEEHIIRTGSSIGCGDIKLNIKNDYDNKNTFLKKHGIDISAGSNKEVIAFPNDYEIEMIANDFFLINSSAEPENNELKNSSLKMPNGNEQTAAGMFNTKQSALASNTIFGGACRKENGLVQTEEFRASFTLNSQKLV